MDIVTISLALVYLLLGVCVAVVFDDSIEELSSFGEFISIVSLWPVMIVAVSIIIMMTKPKAKTFTLTTKFTNKN